MLKIPITDLHIEGTIHTSTSEAQVPHLEIRSRKHSAPSGWKDAAYPELLPHAMEAVIKIKTKQNALATIPVRVLFDAPDSNIKARYEAWASGVEDMPVCIGDGARAKVLNPATGQFAAHVCKGPRLCKMTALNNLKCSLVAKMPVEIDGIVFEYRTSSVNTYRSILAELRRIAALEGGLRQLSLTLGVWEKSTRSSNFDPFTCASIKLGAISKKQRKLPLPSNDALEKLGVDMLAEWDAALDVSEAEMVVEPDTDIAFSLNRRTEPRLLHRVAASVDDAKSSINALFEPYIELPGLVPEAL